MNFECLTDPLDEIRVDRKETISETKFPLSEEQFETQRALPHLNNVDFRSPMLVDCSIFVQVGAFELESEPSRRSIVVLMKHGHTQTAFSSQAVSFTDVVREQSNLPAL